MKKINIIFILYDKLRSSYQEKMLNLKPNQNVEQIIRVLIVDDDEDILFTFATCLENMGLQTEFYSEPSKALAEFKVGYYRFALIDIRMPKLNGFELADKMRLLDKNIKVCFITAFEVYYHALREIYPKLDATCFISKPIGCDALIKHLRKEHMV